MEEDSPNPYQAPEASIALEVEDTESDGKDYQRRKWYILRSLAAYVVLVGFLYGIIDEGSLLLRAVDLVSLIVVAISVIAWCRLDCEQREIRLWSFFALMVVCCPGPLITLIIYLFVSRGLGGFWASAKLAGCAAILIALMFATSFAAEVAVEFLR